MLAADAYTGVPLLISVWGNDFTLHAPSTWLMRHYTSWTMQVADALHADCQRDIRLGKQWGFDPATTHTGHARQWRRSRRIFFIRLPSQWMTRSLSIHAASGLMCAMMYSFKAIPLVLARHPDAKFICASMAGEPQAMQWIKQLDIGRCCRITSAPAACPNGGCLSPRTNRRFAEHARWHTEYAARRHGLWLLSRRRRLGFHPRVDHPGGKRIADDATHPQNWRMQFLKLLKIKTCGKKPQA